jgi:CRISPR-associated endonuclease/helicase Cas3
MGTDIESLKSHPNKPLKVHTKGVCENVKKLTDSKIAEIVAIFHDVGKVNPHFQLKIEGRDCRGKYTDHSYLSAYIFYCMFYSSREGREIIEKRFGIDISNKNNLLALTVLIAKHHVDLPDFMPIDSSGEGKGVLSKDENAKLFEFIKERHAMPFVNLIEEFIHIDSNFDENKALTWFEEKDKQRFYKDKLVFQKGNEEKQPLDFFLDYQFAFASVLLSDKADAGEKYDFIDDGLKSIKEFAPVFLEKLGSHLAGLAQNSQLNRLRTEVRNSAVQKIKQELVGEEVVFELTAPTGSGKTLMMLSLAGEIIKAKGPKRIIYALPFLSITEQVEDEILCIFKGYEQYIRRIDSKSNDVRYEEIWQKSGDVDNEELLRELDILDFQRNTFSYPLVITTFVRFFETLLSNRNAELLKLPNFSNCIFLLDEIQTLPPRLYGFFVAYLTNFCRKFNSYAIVSTATQPDFRLPDGEEKAKIFFDGYVPPKALLTLDYFQHDIFNRYEITFRKDIINREKLAENVFSEKGSVLVILNTIEDTKKIFEKLDDCSNGCDEQGHLILLNTHFTPYDRKEKIRTAKQWLSQGERVIVISTQLIEAGVDIDFPVVYRDFTSVVSIIQSAGRCNRNGNLSMGKVVLFTLKEENKTRSELIYRGKDKVILTYTKQILDKEIYQEKELLGVQQAFFKKIRTELCFAVFELRCGERKIDHNFLDEIEKCQFSTIGRFRLIDEDCFGKEIQYYVPKDANDKNYEEVYKLWEDFFNSKEIPDKSDNDYFLERKRKRKCIESKLREMSERVVRVREKNGQRGEKGNFHFPLQKLCRECYSSKTGIEMNSAECIL